MNLPPPYAEPNNDSLPPDYNEDYKYTFEKPEKPSPCPEYSQAFPINTPRYNDTIFTYIFLATLTIFSYITYASYISTPSKVEFTINSKSSNALITLISVSILAPLISSFVLIVFVYLFPTLFIYLGFLLIPLSLGALSLTSLMAGAMFPSIMFGFLTFLSIMFMLQNFNRFSFSALMVKLVINAMTKYSSTILISIISSLVTAIVSLLFIVSVSIIVNSRILLDDSNCPHPNGNDVCISNTTIIIYIFVTFTGCYILQVIQNTTHVILSGIFSTWYFFDTYDSSNKPRNPSFGSIKRAFTICFGSICFGSLIVSTIQTIRISLQALKAKLQNQRLDNDDENRDSLLLYFLICIVSILAWLTSEFEYWLKWFNRYAYSYLSMYGKPYLKSARDTFEILKYKGIDILINDSLINSAINLYSMLSILVTFSILYVVFNSVNILKEMGPEMLVLGGISSLIASYFIVNSMINVIDVGYVTIMIGLAIDPDSFARINTSNTSNEGIQRLQVWEKLNIYYPGIRERVIVDWPDNN